MRGARAKMLRKAARELCPSGFAERALVELNGTRRRRVIKDVEVIATDKTDLDKKRPARANVTIETFTLVNHPTSLRGRYRLMKRAYMKVKHDHV